jgi:hypothetical protein
LLFLFYMAQKLWEQQPDESQEAYARFLIYRNLGVARSLNKAYQIVPGRTGKEKANGQWHEDCVKYNWVARASAWDISILTEVGQSVVAKYINALDLAFLKIIESLNSEKMKPRTWGSVIESINILGEFIPQETVAEIRRAQDADSVPAIGTSPGAKSADA